MKILLHQCCGPCSIYPVKRLKEDGYIVTVYFYNPNIHPVQEFYKRMESAIIVAQHFNIKYITDNNYGLLEFTRLNAFKEDSRCHRCYEKRINKVAEYAAKNGFDAFSSSLLYSKYQNHDVIKKVCINAGKNFGIDFYYEDFRTGWLEGINISKQMEIYRQNYCGCIYSEMDRFETKLSGKFKEKFGFSNI